MPIALIAAGAGAKRVIGKNNDLPWHFSSDLKFFKEKTMGHAVLMGRVTFESIVKRLGKPLPGRTNIVLTRSHAYNYDGAQIVHSLADLENYKKGSDWLFVIGGAEIFNQTLHLADTIYYTHIDHAYDGDVFFPAIDPNTWNLIDEKPVSEKGILLSFRTYTRKR
jgi:dihydrofolate reductase